MLTPSLPLDAHNILRSGCSHHPSLKRTALPSSAFPSSHPMARTFLDCSQHLSFKRYPLRKSDRASPSGTLAPQGSAGAGTRPAHAGRKVPQAPHRPEPLEPLVASPSWLPSRHEISAKVPALLLSAYENGVQFSLAAQSCPTCSCNPWPDASVGWAQVRSPGFQPKWVSGIFKSMSGPVTSWLEPGALRDPHRTSDTSQKVPCNASVDLSGYIPCINSYGPCRY